MTRFKKKRKTYELTDNKMVPDTLVNVFHSEGFRLKSRHYSEFLQFSSVTIRFVPNRPLPLFLKPHL
jgi:hypothetical protein